MTAAAVADQVLELGDGRALGFKVYGDPAGAPLLFLHGTPGSRLKFAIGHDAGKELGLAIVAPDRWGYGLSDLPDALFAVGALDPLLQDSMLMDELWRNAGNVARLVVVPDALHGVDAADDVHAFLRSRLGTG